MATAQVHGGGSFLDFRFTVRNQQALVANFQRLPEEAHRRVIALNQDWGVRFRDMAIEKAPYWVNDPPPPHHPGFLKDNIEVRFSPGYLAFEVGTWVEAFDAIGENMYSIFQEYGTSKHAAQPFLNPTFEELGPEYTHDMGQLLRDLAREYGGPGSG